MHFPPDPVKRNRLSGDGRYEGQRMKTSVKALPIIAAFLLVIPVAIHAENTQPDTDAATQIVDAATAALMEKTTAYIRDPATSLQQVTVPPPSVDTLAPCQHTPEIIIPGQNRLLVGNITVKAVCREPRWSIHAKANIRIELPVVKSARTIDRDQLIRSDDLIIQPVSLSQIRGRYFAHKTELTGQMASRRITPAQIVRPDMVEPPRIIRKNDDVMIEARINGVTVTMKGMALEGGAMNETIQVRNSSSGKVVKAKVITSGKVVTGMP
ncbi:flagellar basal body P-ring formation chaperone FlgA [Kistimonas asteriae]|uniref:flagellar basal body P-ring formation chaperone FlgA n=1 Tax=Kistimonas asteriae TaxID=517724 RepID=UPI001BAD620E|nr:flagellar basal body P-ring formation chaperone FlgA [Kistimonas asteriae]